MKKVFALILVLLLCVTVVGCSSGGSDNGGSSSSSAASSAADSSSPASSAVSSAASTSQASSKYASIEEYLDDPTVKATVSSALEAYDNELFSDMKVYAEGDKLVYDYTYSQVYDEDQVATMRETLESKSDDEFKLDDVVEELKTYVDVENPQVEVIYRNGDGTIIASRTFG